MRKRRWQPSDGITDIRREHPNDYDREQFRLQDERQSWSMLWWEKQEVMNSIWWHKLHDWPQRK